ncbi:hypothetical protein KDA11_05155, partial [Candidatus Saccharibacteria bacterium]|nr:hypothetical protein [Candidatus Saccharibacteria bacterium]
AELGQLVKLRVLLLIANHLSFLPIELGRLHNLQDLYINNFLYINSSYRDACRIRTLTRLRKLRYNVDKNIIVLQANRRRRITLLSIEAMVSYG